MPFKATLMVLLLCVGCGDDSGGVRDPSLLEQAVSAGDLDATRGLLNDGVDPNSHALTLPAVSVAAADGNVEMVNLLLDNGAEADVRDDENWTPLFSASMGGSVEVVESLLGHGADPCVVTDQSFEELGKESFEGMRASQVARAQGYVDIAEVLEAAEVDCE